MSGRFVRASKYRHVFGRPTRREQCYDNLHVSKNAFDTNLIKANPSYLAVNWEASGGGAFAVIPLEEKGKLPELLPLFRGHTSAVLDTDWNPFHDDIIASGSDDGKVFLWKVPENFTLFTDAEEPADVKPVGKLSGHSRKVGHVLFNPAAENVLASNSGDFTVKLWDLEDGKSKLTLKHSDIVQSLSWSANGSMLVTTSRDKKMRFWDVRQEKPAHEVSGHAGAKNSRIVWLGDHDRVVTTGFSRMSERQLGLWDIRDPSKPVGGDFQLLDTSSGVAMPFWDDGCQMLYIGGKGDGNIRYYEYEHDKLEFLSEYKSGDPQRGLAFLPKRGVNTHENEVMRGFKTVNDLYIEPISFIVPRRSENFQEDIYPPAVGTRPGLSSAEWLAGKDAFPPKISMEDVFDGTTPKEVAASAVVKPAASPDSGATKTPEPTKTSAPKPEPVAAPVAAATREMPSVNDNKKSMAAMASKFADKEDVEPDHDDDSSSFEEIPKPVERPSVVAARQQEAESKSVISRAAASATTASPPAPQPAAVPATKDTATSVAASKSASEPKNAESAAPTPSSIAGGLHGAMNEIRELLHSQGRQIEQLTSDGVLSEIRELVHSQTRQLEQLASEVAQLKAKVGE